VAATLALASLPVLAASAAAWTAQCDGFPPSAWFEGLAEDHLNNHGVRALIEYNNPALCLNPAPGDGETFSASWVGLVKTTHPYNIYQVGLDKCQNRPGCPAGVYYFWAYGRQQGACAMMLPLPNNVGAANANSYWYQIIKIGAYFHARIAGVTKDTKLFSSLDTCWGGISGWQILDEVGDPGDEAGSQGADTRFYSSITWRDHLDVDHALNRPFSSPCDVEELSTMNCWVASNLHDAFYTDDTR
jgi:hypothetical protein